VNWEHLVRGSFLERDVRISTKVGISAGILFGMLTGGCGGAPAAVGDGGSSDVSPSTPGVKPDATTDAKPDAAVSEVASSTTLTGIVALSAGDSFTCALLDSGAIYCWGVNDEGQLGDGKVVASGVYGQQKASRVVGIGSATSLASGRNHSCASLGDGTVSCWGGANDRGQLGTAAPTPGGAPTPLSVASLTDVRRVFVSDETSCAQKNDGAFLCWGAVTDGKGTATPSLSGITGTVVDFAGRFPGSGYAAIEGGTVTCWAEDKPFSTRDGCGTFVAPAAFTRLSGKVTQMTGDHGATCAVIDTGAVECWGLNTFAMLGDPSIPRGSTVTEYGPQPVATLAGAKGISGSNGTMCALADGGVSCWGGPVPQTTPGRSNATARNIMGIGTGATAIAAGLNHLCVVLPDTSAQCWGFPDLRGDRTGAGPQGVGGLVLR
jgi:alpha-tubulin suppressor-like RCC1 family protein